MRNFLVKEGKFGCRYTCSVVEQPSHYTREDWDQLLHCYGAVSADTPAICFSEDLIDAYPHAKVVLTHRDVDKWFESFDKAVIMSITDWGNWAACMLSPSYLGKMKAANERSWLGWQGMKNDRTDMRTKAKAAYLGHYEHIRKITPPERLLEFKLEDGWKPLCEFLDKPVPDRPFPHVNDSKAIQEKIQIIIRRGVRDAASTCLVWCSPVLVIAVAVYLLRVS